MNTNRCVGGELFDRILKLKSFTERHALKIARSLMDAIQYLHSHGIVHTLIV